MLHALVLLMPIPPVQAGTPSSEIISWIMIGIIFALFLIGTALWVVGNRRMAHRTPQLPGERQPQEAQPEVQVPVEKVLLHR